MIDNVTLGVSTADSRARVSALVADAGLIGGTVGIQETLGSTSFVGVANVSGEAGTRACTVQFFANCVGAAGGWIAGINGRRSCRGYKVQRLENSGERKKMAEKKVAPLRSLKTH